MPRRGRARREGRQRSAVAKPKQSAHLSGMAHDASDSVIRQRTDPGQAGRMWGRGEVDNAQAGVADPERPGLPLVPQLGDQGPPMGCGCFIEPHQPTMKRDGLHRSSDEARNQ